MTRVFVRRAVTALAAAVILLVLTAAAASAHAQLVRSEPAEGAHLQALPSTVRLTFDDPVQLSGATITVHSATGALALTDLSADGPTTIVASVPRATGISGAVTVDWDVVADDGHPSSGTIDLGVGAGLSEVTSSGRSTASSGTAAVDRLFTIDRVVGYLAMAVVVGGWVFLTSVWPAGAGVRRTRLVLWLGWALGLLATVAGLGLQAATVTGGRLGSAVSGSALADVIATDFGHAWLARVALFLLAIPVLRALRTGATVPRAPWWIVSAAAVGIALLRTPGFVSHAGEGDMAVAGSIADLVHLAGVAIWVGGLVLLVTVVLPRRRPAELASIVPRFSTLALGSVVAIVVGGAVMSWELVGGWTPLYDSQFGRVLLVKLLVFAAVIAAARRSQRWVHDRLGSAVALRGHVSLVRPFVYSVAAEALLAATVVAIASVLVATGPGT